MIDLVGPALVSVLWLFTFACGLPASRSLPV
jgi:hypothetical protein